MEVFNLSKLNGQLVGHQIAWSSISDYIKNARLVDQYAKDKAATIGDCVLYDSEESLMDAIKDDIRVGLDIYNRQMFVVTASLLERAIKQFLTTLFVVHPMRMYEFLGTAKNKGKVDLSSIANAESKDALIIQLARRAAASAASGSIADKMKRLRTLSNCTMEDFPETLEKKISGFVSHRNVVVHEKIPRPCRREDVEELLTSVSKMLDVLDRLATKNDLPVDRDGHCLLWADEEFYE